MKQAVIFGISGILGQALAKHLLLCGDWRVSGVARKKSPKLPDDNRIHMIYCDLLDRDNCEKNLAPAVKKVTHMFFTAWVPNSDPQKEVDLNLTMFRNALDIVDASSSSLEKVYLQTGTKYYGVQVGPEKGLVTPSKESAPRVPVPNFYYDQEDYLKKKYEETKSQKPKGKGWTWTVARPDCIIGYSTGNFMNFGTTLAVYAAILKELNEPLVFPYSWETFHAIREVTDVNLLVKGILWMIENDHCQNEAFNITNGDCFRFENTWKKIADYFGMEAQLGADKLKSWKSKDSKFDISTWAKDKQPVWDRIVSKYNLQKNSLDELCTWSFVQFTLNRAWDDLSSTTKARQYGFLETLDSEQMWSEFFDTLKIAQVIPEYESNVEESKRSSATMSTPATKVTSTQ